MNQKLKSESQTSKRGDLWLGIALLGTSILTFILSGSIQAIGLGDNQDPGPKAFPIGLALLLALGGIIELWQSFSSSPETSPIGKDDNAESASKANSLAPRPSALAPSTSSQSNPRTVLLLLACFLIYVILVPWLGFALSTLVMATTMMVLLGNAWKQSLLVSIILIILVYALFVVLFKVPLPGGVFNLPF